MEMGWNLCCYCGFEFYGAQKQDAINPTVVIVYGNSLVAFLYRVFMMKIYKFETLL